MHGRITQHVSILDAGRLLFDADTAEDVALGSCSEISSEVATVWLQVSQTP